LLLVGWSPVTLDDILTDPVKRVIAALSHATAYLVQGLHVRVWRPAPEAIRRLEYLRLLREPDLVRDWFVTSLREDLWDLSAFLEDRDEHDSAAHVDVQIARSHLQRGLAEWPGAGPMPDRAQRAYEQYSGALQRELLTPLRQQALSSDLPERRAAGLQLVELIACQLQSAPILLAQLQKAVVSGDDGKHEEILRKIAQHLKITQQFRRCGY
jgi:hypothetical protein